MASYEYHGTYFDIYYLFVTDSDASNAGAEGSPATVRISSSDTGGADPSTGEAVTFAGALVPPATATSARPGRQWLQRFKPPHQILPPPAPAITANSADTGTGTDAASAANATLTSSDTGSVDPSTGEAGARTILASSSDTGSGAEGTPATIRLNDQDSTNVLEIDPVSDIDVCTLTGEDITIQVFADNDTATTSELEVKLQLFCQSDINQGSVELLNWFIKIAQADTGSAAETATGGKKIPDTDVSTSTETQSFHPGAFDPDTAIATEASSIFASGYTDADTGSSANAEISISSPVASSDTAHATENQINGPTTNDAGSATQEAVSAFRIIPQGDTGSVNPVLGEVGSFPNNKIDADMGHATEASTITATANDADAFTVAHQPYWSQGENEFIDIPAWYAMKEQSFSISRCAILNTATGIESAQLFAVRSGQITLNVTAYDQVADDTHIGAWYDITSARVEIQVGFMSWDALASVLGYHVTSTSDKAALAMGLQSMPATIEVPMLMRTSGRDHYGRIRTLDIILYKTRLTMTTGADAAFSYKQGLQVSMIGTATSSKNDEAGHPLPASYWSNTTGYSFGRIVSSPGQLTSTLTPAYGAST